MKNTHVIFLSGASGAGKTTLIKALSKKYEGAPNVSFLFFDSIGVPSLEEMIERHGSSKKWQEDMTYEWVRRIAENHADKEVVFIEGQTELTFVKDAFKKYNIESYTIMLIHAKSDERHRRLISERNQADLVNNDMDNWANYLLNQATDLEYNVINTSEQSFDSSIEILETFLKGI